ncbi:hypothetical protein [Kineosporia babensis]|uniref:Uncharacterized protein n=1 Tax=Kineosporia babensis TaxID=499548 RepID=A0A9X1NKI2_9ACTN|nr:hypothetical protein [Kineosporia babensis]MCD5315376.1 hypothetical protein [Kineosporia babensis]
MSTTESQTPGAPTISVATMNAISIDLDAGISRLPRQGVRPGPQTRD